MTVDELKQHFFEMSFALDSYSAEKNYTALRRTHYDNTAWMHEKGLQYEYYQFFIEQIKTEVRGKPCDRS